MMILPSYTAAIPSAGGGGGGLPLDSLSAMLAVSLRKLRAAYTGNCIRVRRSSDNTEQDIGFSGNTLDTSALTSFVGANDGFIVTWYDQSGAGTGARVVTQSSSSKQPKIVSSGSIGTGPGGLPTIDFDGTDDGLLNQNNDGSGVNISSIISASAYTAYAIFQADSISSSVGSTYTAPFIFGDSGRYMGVHLQNSSKLRFYNWDGSEDYAEISGMAAATGYALETRHESGTLYAKVNGGSEVNAASGNTASTGGSLYLAQNSSVYYDGKISEVIFFNTALGSSDRATLHSNIRGYYSV